MLVRLNPTLDEGLSGDPRAIELADTRAAIRVLISNRFGIIDWSKARDLAVAHHMCAATVINFAIGKTLRPSTYTVNAMIEAAGYRLVMIPAGAQLPTGAIEFK